MLASGVRRRLSRFQEPCRKKRFGPKTLGDAVKRLFGRPPVIVPPIKAQLQGCLACRFQLLSPHSNESNAHGSRPPQGFKELHGHLIDQLRAVHGGCAQCGCV